MQLRKILEGRPLGHPLHSLIVHLPLGLWLLGAGLDVYGFFWDTARWALEVAGWALLLGTGAAVLAVITGLNDWLDIREDHPAQKSALVHMAMMIPATVLFAVATLLHFTHRQAESVTGLMLGTSVTGYLLAMIGGYVGGLLVYDDGIGVGRHRRTTSLPQKTVHEPRKGVGEPGLSPSAGLGREFHPVIPESALKEGETLRVEVRGTVFVIVRAQKKVYAVQEFCTHRCGPLSEGAVDGCEIQCPWHNSRFDLVTGKPTHGPAKVALKTYEVRVRGGIIHVREDAGDSPDSEVKTSAPAERRNPKETQEREAERPASPRRAPTDQG